MLTTSKTFGPKSDPLYIYMAHKSINVIIIRHFFTHAIVMREPWGTQMIEISKNLLTFFFD